MSSNSVHQKPAGENQGGHLQWKIPRHVWGKSTDRLARTSQWNLTVWRIILVTSGKEWCIDHHCLLSPTLNATCTKSLAKCFTKKLLFASLFHTLTAFLYWQNISGQVSDMEAEQNITKWNEKRSSSFYQRNILLNSFFNLNKFWMNKQQNIFDGGLFCGFLRGGWPLPAALWWKWPKHNSFGVQLKSSYNKKTNNTPFCFPVLPIVTGRTPFLFRFLSWLSNKIWLCEFFRLCLAVQSLGLL